MATVFLVLVVVLVVAALIFGIIALLSGDDPGLVTAEPDGRARPLPNNRSLAESDLKDVRFDVSLRGYRMAQVDRVLRRTAYDLGYKDEMIAVLEAEVIALRDGRLEDAELLRKARESAANPLAASDTAPAGEPSVVATSAAPTWAPSDFARPEPAAEVLEFGADEVGPDVEAVDDGEPEAGADGVATAEAEPAEAEPAEPAEAGTGNAETETEAERSARA